jgi:hypothetical protein
MRKKISCKIIRSVSLGESADGLRKAGKPKAHRAKTRRTASVTYTNRLVLTRTSIDEGFRTRALDFCV